MSTLQIVLRNNTSSPTVYAHITGTTDNGLFLLNADGQTAYHPSSPASGATMQPLGADCAINLGGPGSSRTVTIPLVYGGRIWFCKENPLNFFLNPGPSLVEPSPTNTGDANYDLDWGFCEFTYNTSQLYINVSYVDFVSLPVSFSLENQSGQVRKVAGMPSDGLDRVCQGLEAQGGVDHAGWEKLVIKSTKGTNLRALSPNAGAVLIPSLFNGYYQSYVDAVWAKYANEDLTINTQFTWGDVKGRTQGDKIVFNGVGEFAKPSALDIFSCNSGPFGHGPGVSEQMLNIGARISAALNRSTLLTNTVQPEGEKVATYYQNPVTNHYSRICHEVVVAGKGYAFPYDDVGASNSEDQSGFLNDPAPKVLTVAVGSPL